MTTTKAQTLLHIKQSDSDIKILPVYIVESAEFYVDSNKIIQDIIHFANNSKLIVRSSSSQEDCRNFSNAGNFDSILNVAPTEEQIFDAIDKVYRSYNTKLNEQILIQPMLQNVAISGVVFTADMDTFAEYDIINYSVSSDTEAVTGGNNGELCTYVHYRRSGYPITDNDFNELINICRKIEKIVGCNAIDVEFGITKSHEIYIFQVRPIAKGLKNEKRNLNLDDALNRIYKKFLKLSKRHPFLLGNTTCFGVMPDWNPAEILGVRPRKLAISLYKELVTDSVWAYQRSNYGYRNLTMHPLMVSFCGIPYIDTRITFNSFIPENLNEKIAEKLVNYYLDKLQKYPKYHDKIEFEIVFSCYYFGISDKLKMLMRHGFNENEIKRIEYSLLDITNQIIRPKDGLYKKDIEQAAVLDANYNKILNSDMALVDKIYWLIEECKQYGTLTFAGVARAGFISVQFLKSFVEYGIMTQDEYDKYMNSLSTVSKQMSKDLLDMRQGRIQKQDFIEKYGHIRPGTYDIMSKRYDEDFEAYFCLQNETVYTADCSEQFEFDSKRKEKIQIELEQHGIQVTVDELLQFFKEAIEGRESLKFVFTKSVSMILSLIEELGNRNNISREDMSYLDISVVKQLYTDLYYGNVQEIFEKNIFTNKKLHEYALQIKLPSIIMYPENVYQYYLFADEPNFITQKSISADTVVLENASVNANIEGKIVFIRSADPGYDYIFSKNIGGLITQFGGANSHMAIRCAELGIPAVIGAGEKNYKEWRNARKLLLDCSNRKVRGF